MPSMSYSTAGESHGKGLVVIVRGLPAGLGLEPSDVLKALARRRGGAGRGSRMRMEDDRVELVSGVLRGRATGSPLAMFIPNRDFSIDGLPPVTAPRPGHADLAGCLKYGIKDARSVLERASARETAARTAAGAVAAALLRHFGVQVFGHVTAIGGVESGAGFVPRPGPAARKRRDASQVFCLDSGASKRMEAAVDRAGRTGDTLGGIVEAIAFGAPAGLGSPDERLDAAVASALMSVPSVKGVEIGFGFALASVPGSMAHDEIRLERGAIRRPTNRAGGIEGGMSNGEPIVARAAVKPIPTLGRPLPTVDLETLRNAEAARVRSDVCAVPAVSVIAEHVMAFEIASAFRSKFGGDTLADMKAAFDAYMERTRDLLSARGRGKRRRLF